ncbi:cytochrome P450 4C1-like isoform X2 [Varroa jacobsoni]|uniref:cytochrome P450 4C1-like isoform X2 n=1 Tax=Varroa jacobsoni TaxID=62625 RepID=UPI000BF8DEBB|nr:cytochrome P450 4C1-like isoform X2 [Varroa jacobsoni]
MQPLFYVVAFVITVYTLFLLSAIWYKWHSWRYPLPETGFIGGPPSMFVPFFREISFLMHCLRYPEIDFLAHVYRAFEGLETMYREKGAFRVWVGAHPFVMLSDPQAAEVLLTSNKHIEKAQSYELLHPWLGTGLLTSTGPKWRSRRKLLTPAFHFGILEDFVEVFDRQSQLLGQRIESEFGSARKPFDICNEASLCTLDIICETAMGVQLKAQRASQSAYVQAVHSVGASFIKRNTNPWLRPEFLFRMTSDGKAFYKALDVLHSFTRRVINERYISYKADMSSQEQQQTEVAGKRKKRAFLDLLIETHYQNPRALTLADIAEEVDTFMFEGHDTTAMGVSWCLYLLGHHPIWQQRIFEEIIEVMGTDLSAPITSKHLPRLKYLECAIKESQRLYPSVPLIGRRLRRDLPLRNRVIPAGSTILLLIMQLHRQPEIYPWPEEFMPERFYQKSQNESAQDHSDLAISHPYAYVPFSAGPRNCIGQRFALMEEKVVVANVLRRVEVRSLTPRDEVQVSINLVTRAAGGLKMCARSRQYDNTIDHSKKKSEV